MSLNAYDAMVNEAGLFESVVKFVGGTAAVTKVFGSGVTVTYSTTGIVILTWQDPQGTYVGVTGHCFEATTASAVKGYTVVPGAFNTTANTLTLNITNAGETLADLAALQWLTLKVAFKRRGVTG